MRYVKIIRKDGGRDEVPVYGIDDFPYEDLNPISITNRRKNNAKSYCITFGTFDIETTTITRPDGSTYGYMYIWQMTVGGIVCIGRTWEEWIYFIKKVLESLNCSQDKTFVIYVHNLAFEFQFIRDFLQEYFGGFEIFANAPRKPINVRTESMEFRCSYKLTNMSLKKALENELGVVHVKADGDLDYSMVRTPETELTEQELGYCVSDVVGLHELIERRLINEKDSLASIPMTSTGYVRRDCRKATKKAGKKYRDYFKRMALSEEVYTLLREEARGGDTHANRYMAGMIWEGVDSFDIKSSYPFQMFRKYPVTPYSRFGHVDDMDTFRNLLDTKACLFRCAFYGLCVKPETQMPYIPFSKCTVFDSKTVHIDNGRVLSCSFIILTLLEIDYKIIEETYTWDSIAITDMHTAELGELPKCLTDQVMLYFRRKCELELEIKRLKMEGKNTDNERYLYTKQKNRLNSIFGMCYQNPVMATLFINEEGEWDCEETDIAAALKKYFSSRNNFLIYTHGCYICAYGREWLHRMRQYAGTTIYSDTDSCKCINADYAAMDKFNEEIKKWDEERGCIVDLEGQKFYLGYVEKENDVPIKKFKTLGAKKYVYEDDDGLHITISGVDKNGWKELGCVENFEPGFTFTKNGGLTLEYNDELNIHEITVEGCTFTTASNIGMSESTYTVGITEDYAALIGYKLLAELY